MKGLIEAHLRNYQDNHFTQFKLLQTSGYFCKVTK